MERIYKGDTLIIRWPFIDKNNVPFNLDLATATVYIMQGLNTKATYVKGTDNQVRVDGGTLVIEITSTLSNLLKCAVTLVRVKLSGGDGEMAVQLGSVNSFARNVFEVTMAGEIITRDKVELPPSRTSFQIYPVASGDVLTTEDDKILTTEDGKIIII